MFPKPESGHQRFSTARWSAHTVSHDYDPATGNLRSVQAPDTAPTYYEYDDNGNVKKTRFGTAETVFDYNVYGRLTLTVSPTGLRREVRYDANGNRDLEWTTWVNPDNPTQTRLLQTVNTFDSNDRLTQTRDPEGQLTTNTYDALDRVKQTVTPTSVSETKYDARGLVVERRSPVRPGAADYRVVRTAYDEQGRPTYATDEYLPITPTTTTYATYTEYDGAGRVKRTERRSGVRLDIAQVAPDVYSSSVAQAGTLVSYTTTTYNDLGQVSETRDAAGLITRSFYNPRGQSTRGETQLNPTTIYLTTTDYDDAGRAVRTRDAAQTDLGTTTNDNTVLTLLDPAKVWALNRWQGAEVEIVSGMGEGQRVAVAGNEPNPNRLILASPGWDPARIPDSTSRYVIHGKATQTEYDGAGRPTKVTAVDGKFTQTVYDDFGRKTGQTDELLRTTSYEYDAYGRLTAVVQPLLSGPSVRPRTTYFYDAYGSLRAQTDALGHDTTFRYDAYQRQVQRTLPGIRSEGTAAVTTPPENRPTRLTAGTNPNWLTNQWQGGLVRLTAGTGAGQIREVVSNTGNELTIAGTWVAGQEPDATSRYVVTAAGSRVQSQTTQDSQATTLVDSTQNWTANQWQGGQVQILSGSGQGQVRTVLSNSGTQLVIAGTWTVNPQATDQYLLTPREEKGTA